MSAPIPSRPDPVPAGDAPAPAATPDLPADVAQAEFEAAERTAAALAATAAAANAGPAPKKLAAALARPLWIIAILLILAALYFTSDIMVPFVLAALMALTLAPAVRALTAVKIPRAFASAVVVAALIGVGAAVFAVLAEPAQSWFQRAPQALKRLEFGMRGLLKPLEQASEATENLMRLGQKGAPAAGAVVAAEPNPAMTMLSQAPYLVGSLLLTLFLVFLFLMYGENLMRKFVSLLPQLSQKKWFVAGTREAQHELSVYLLTISAINLALGALTTVGLWYLGVPDPLLWGGVAALLNYAPYVGAVMTIAVLLVVGFAQFNDPWMALAVPGWFALLNIFEGQLVTPMLVGKRLALDPVVIFLSLMVFGWLWGITGMLLAVPVLSCLRIVASRMPEGHTLETILADNPKPSPEDPKTPIVA